jgi:hypothetical protein
MPSSLASQRRYSDADLLILVREVAIAARPECPVLASQHSFNKARGEAGTPACPEAAYIVRRLKCSWQEVLSFAFQADGLKQLSWRGSGEDADKDTCAAALYTIATRLKVRTLRPGDYEQERIKLLAGSRGSHQAKLKMRLPSAALLDYYGWEKLLQAVSLSPRGVVRRAAGAPPTLVIEKFLEAQGRLPSRMELEKFAKERGISLDREQRLSFEELREKRSKEGLWTPPRIPKRDKRPPWQAPEGQVERDTEYPASRRNYWTLELVQQGLYLAIQELQPGEHLTLHALRRLAKTSDAIPTASVVGRIAKKHGTTITALRAEAIRRHW